MTKSEFETHRSVVYPWHCDFNGHMNVMHYVSKFDEATWHFLAQIGITPSYLKRENRAMVAVEQNFKYTAELFAGDLVCIRTGLVELKAKSVIFTHRMYNGETGVLAAEARMVGVHLDTAMRRSTPFPASIFGA